MAKPGRVLIIAGSDSSGGAGMQADLKTVSALGAYGMTAITALTAQNTLGVFGVFPVTPEFVAQQIRLCLDDIGADIVKTGMLHSAEIIEVVAKEVPTGVPLVLDPVMVAKGGAALLEDAALAALKKLIHRAYLLTPNLPEAELLLGRAIPPEGMEQAATELLAFGPRAVLLKGGHAEGEIVTDLLVQHGHAPLVMRAKRLTTRHTHGTGCTLASAIAAGLAQGLDLVQAVQKAHVYVQQALANAPGLGQGHGPLGSGLPRTGN